MSDLMLDVDQAGELKAAFRRGRWTNAEIKEACQGNFLTQVREVLLKRAVVLAVEHVIDMDATPFCPDGCTMEEHRKGGQWKWDPEQVKLHLAEGQKNGKWMKGHDLRRVLSDQSVSVLNANVLDYLLKPENQYLIPECWIGKVVFFWGTIYRNSAGDLCVRCLCWHGVKWLWDWYWLGSEWDGSSPAVARAN